MPICESILDAVGGTPLVALDRLAAGLPARVLLKMESLEPCGCIKERVALAVLEEAERQGKLRPGGVVIELTSGNMGIGLAMACAVKGYRLIAVMSEGNSEERRRVLRALGAQVELVPQAGSPRPGQVSGEDLALVEARTRALVEELGAFRPDQFHNRAAVTAHERETGPEIWEQSGGRVDFFCAAVGTAGTFLGIAHALKQRRPAVRAYAVEPAGAAILAGKPITHSSHKIQGTGYALVPPLWDPAVCDGFLAVADEEAVDTARALAAREGILAGFSTGANVSAALRLAREATPGQVVVTVAPDSGFRYFSTDLFA